MKIAIPTFDMEGPATQIFPNPGDAVVQCSQCGKRAFQIHVSTPGPDSPDAIMTEIVCLGCGHTAKNLRQRHTKGIQ